MNRLEMSRLISERVPLLVQTYSAEWKHLERLRQQFVRDYSISRIPVLTLDEYVIGKGKGNASFCYRVERELDRRGRILGATAFKFVSITGRPDKTQLINTDIATYGAPHLKLPLLRPSVKAPVWKQL